MKTVILTVFVAFITFNVQGQNKREKIVQLFELMKTDKMMDAILDNMQGMMSRNLPLGVNAEKDSLFHVFIKQEVKAFTEGEQRQEMVDAYDKNFTVSEIEKYLVFYKSPEGKKMIDVMPGIQKDMMANMQVKFMPGFTERMKNKMAEIYGN